MMYVEVRQKFFLADSSELMGVRVISASWAQKRLIPSFYTWGTSSSLKIFLSPIRGSWWVLESFGLLGPKTFDSSFLDMMYVEFMKNYFLADSHELMGVRVISVFWAQRRVIPTCYTWCASSCRKIFFSPIRANWWVFESFRSPEPKNVWFPLSRHDVRRVHSKFFSHLFARTDGC